PIRAARQELADGGRPSSGRSRKARPDAERRTPDGAPEGATPSQEGVQIKDCRAIWRAVPSPFGEAIRQNSGAAALREQ
ncbi:MAG: hypothetical protein WCF39_11480, partial [Pseudolabrys sp.]